MVTIPKVNYSSLPNFNTGGALPAGMDWLALVILVVVLVIAFRIAMLFRRR